MTAHRPTLFCFAVLAALSAVAPAAEPSFERDVAPFLRTYCAGCHSGAAPEGELSLETFAALRRGGSAGDPLVPGDAAASLLARRLAATGDEHMPPATEPQPTPAEIDVVLRWIAAGAPPPATDVSILGALAVPRLPASAAPLPVTALAVAADGRVAVARDRDVALLPAGAGEPLRLADPPGRVTALHLTADARRLVVAGGVAGLTGSAQLRDPASGALVASFGPHRDIIHDAELSPDGTILATAGYDRSVKLWRVADGSLVRSIDVHNGPVFDLAWHPGGALLASASADETVKLWRAADGLRLDTLSQPQGEVTAVRFTPDGRHLVAAGRDRRIHLWQVTTLDAPGLNPPLVARFAHETPIVALAVSADGAVLASAAEDATVSLWSLPDVSLLGSLPPQGDVVSVLAATPDGGFLGGRMDGTRVVIPRPAGPVVAAVPPARPAPGAVPPYAPSVAAGPIAEPVAVAETEPNDTPAAATAVPPAVVVSGTIGAPGDADVVRFSARAGQTLLLETHAVRAKSPLDSRIEVLHGPGPGAARSGAAGMPVERVVLRATRDSYFTFRGKDSSQSDDFRLHNWMEMELDELLYSGGEVVKLWLYPRGPDSGFKVYPGTGKRETLFDTTAVTHALGEPAWIVTPLPPGSQPPANGLPVFRLTYDNDDAANRRLGTDSQLLFTPPADGDYLARVSDVRGFGGPEFTYTLTIRPARPRFSVAIGGMNPKVSPGSGRELGFTVTRDEGFTGPVAIAVDNLPAGFSVPGPIEIEAGQERAVALLVAAPDAVAPDEALDKFVRVTATATIDGRAVTQDLGSLGDIQLADAPKLTVEILDAAGRGRVAPEEPLVFAIRPGATITARVRAVRHDFAGRIELGGDDSGRNLPHGCYVDNIGLNGLLIVEGQTEREFFITAAPITTPGRRLFHLRATADGGQCSLPAVIEVLPAAPGGAE
jgi:mono/diheme cytochrome c family protein